MLCLVYHLLVPNRASRLAEPIPLGRKAVVDHRVCLRPEMGNSVSPLGFSFCDGRYSLALMKPAQKRPQYPVLHILCLDPPARSGVNLRRPIPVASHEDT